MKGRLGGAVCVGFMISLFAVSSVVALNESEDSRTAEWTILVYVAGDNNLEAEAFVNLDQVEAVAPSDDVNVIMMIDTMTMMDGVHWYFVNDGDDHIDLAAGENLCDCGKIAGGCPGELNTGDGETLEYFIANGATFAPAKNYMLLFWNHGASWYGVCWDDSSILEDGEADCLQMCEISDVFESTASYLPDGRFQIIGFDACLMAGIEVAYQIRNHSEYMVGAITTISALGWAYGEFVAGVDQMDDPSPFEVGKVAVDTYMDKYSICTGNGIGGYPYASLSLIDLSCMDALVEDGMKPFSTALLKHVTESARKGYIQSAEARTPQLQYLGEFDPFIDLGLFAEAIAVRYLDMAETCEDVVRLVGEAVVYFDYVVSDYGGCMKTTGMSIWYTVSWNHLHDCGGLEYYATMDFGIDTDWDEFLAELSEQPLY